MPAQERDRPEIALIVEDGPMVVTYLYGGAEAPPADLADGTAVDVLPWPLDQLPWTPDTFDVDSGLEYNRARSYCDIPGTWMTEEPHHLRRRETGAVNHGLPTQRCQSSR
jgi:hypothetical protein